MYIKKGSVRRMRLYHTRNERSFNAQMNELAGTHNVAYSTVWPMSVSNGKQYLDANKQAVARVYAGELLHGRVRPGSLLSLHDNHLTTNQRTALSYLRQSTDKSYASALHMCNRYNALPRAAAGLFGSAIALGNSPSSWGVEHAMPVKPVKPVELVEPVEPMEHVEPVGPVEPVEHAMPVEPLDAPMDHLQTTASSTPTRKLSLNAPGSASHSLALKKNKRPRKK